VPESFSRLLLERYRDYGDSEEHKNSFRYFATRILPAVNASQTKFDKRKYSETLSDCFSYTDEAFGILLVMNYEARWQSQHTAIVVNPSGTKQEQSEMWKDGRYTSTTEGSRRGVSWQGQGLVKFNELSQMVKQQRGVDKDLAREENEVEQDLMAWCRTEAGMSPLPSSHGNENAGVIPNDMAEEDEVEAMGECDIFEI
jgi:DNA primase